MSGKTVREQFDLSGRVALITGASGHLGRALASGLAEAGANVVVVSRSLERAQEAARELPSVSGAKHFAIAIDHLNSDSIEEGFASAVKTAGRVDILVNNGHEATTKTWHDVSDDE